MCKQQAHVHLSSANTSFLTCSQVCLPESRGAAAIKPREDERCSPSRGRVCHEVPILICTRSMTAMIACIFERVLIEVGAQ